LPMSTSASITLSAKVAAYGEDVTYTATMP
jgi:hypothetical protein